MAAPERGKEYEPEEMLAQLQGLADIANGKQTLAGGPFGFTAEGPWLTQFFRIRDALAKSKIYLSESSNVSGEWIFPGNNQGSNPKSLTTTGQSGQLNTTYIDFSNPTYPYGVFYKNVRPNFSGVGYMFPASSGAGESMTANMVLEWTRDSENPWQPSATRRTFKAKVKSSVGGKLSGKIVWTGSKPVNTELVWRPHGTSVGLVDFAFNFGGRPADTFFRLVATIKENVNDFVGDFEIGITVDSPAQITIFDGGVRTTSGTQSYEVPFTWSKTFTGASEIPGIHPTLKCWRINSVGLDGFGILPAPQDVFLIPEDVAKNFGSNDVNSGNFATITYTPTNQSGVFVAHCQPVSRVNFYDDISVAGPEPGAKQSSPKSGDVNAGEFSSTLAIGYHVPRYPVLRDTDAFKTIPLSERVEYGSCIYSVTVLRPPVVNENGFSVPDPDLSGGYDVAVGCIRNGAFALFKTITIEAGALSKTEYVTWPIFDTTQPLIYQALHPAYVSAAVMGPNPQIGSGVSGAVLHAFYTDTLNLLSLIP